MRDQQEKTTYLITFNKDIYAFDSIQQPLLGWDREHLKSYLKGQTIEVSEKLFALLLSNDGISDSMTLPVYDKRAYCKYSVKDIDSVKKRVVWTQTTQYVNTIEGADGISAWSKSFSAARLCEDILGDESNITADQWMKNDRKKTLLESQDIPGFESTLENLAKITV